MMKYVLIAALLAPAAALADGSAFDGTWKLRLDSVKVTGKADQWLLAGGSYSCQSCDPAVDPLPADGAFHKVSGHAYYDELMVRVVDDHAVEVSQKQNGKLVGTVTMQVSADGTGLTGKFTSYSGAQPVTGTFTEKRIAAGPAGAHAISGSWLQDQISGNDALTHVQYAMTAADFTMRANGQSYTARFDGRKYPVEGDPGHTEVVLKKINVRTVHETDYRQGRVVDEIDLIAAADGKSLLVTDRDVAHGQTTSMVFDKQ